MPTKYLTLSRLWANSAETNFQKIGFDIYSNCLLRTQFAWNVSLISGKSVKSTSKYGLLKILSSLLCANVIMVHKASSPMMSLIFIFQSIDFLLQNFLHMMPVSCFCFCIYVTILSLKVTSEKKRQKCIQTCLLYCAFNLWLNSA